MLTKQYSVSVKELATSGLFRGYAAVFGNVDSDNEVIDKGAFKETIKKNNGIVPVLWGHDRKTPVGWNQSAVEDDYGLSVEARLMIDTETGKTAHSFLKMAKETGTGAGLSIGFRVPANGDYRKDGVRHFREIELMEFSVVLFAANDRAAVTEVKGAVDFNAKLSELRSSLQHDGEYNRELRRAVGFYKSLCGLLGALKMPSYRELLPIEADRLVPANAQTLATYAAEIVAGELGLKAPRLTWIAPCPRECGKFHLFEPVSGLSRSPDRIWISTEFSSLTDLVCSVAHELRHLWQWSKELTSKYTFAQTAADHRWSELDATAFETHFISKILGRDVFAADTARARSGLAEATKSLKDSNV